MTTAPAPIALLLGLLLGGCLGDTLYDGDEADPTGPNTALTSHRVSIEASLPGRVEVSDSIQATVRWRDESRGISRVGLTALVLGRGSDTLDVIVVDETYAAPRLGSDAVTFRFPLNNVGGPGLPDSVRVELHGFAVNASGVCAAAISGTEQRLACRPVANGFVALDSPALRNEVVITAGRTFALPAGGRIADALVAFSVAPRLYLSNLTGHSVDVLDLGSTFGAVPEWRRVPVGSEPWGLALELGGANVLVANSGGTSISFLSTGSLTETPASRLQTPNTALWEITVRTDTLGRQRYEGVFYDFSDRPQFIAQDFTGRILYSTVPTPAAGLGTIRYAERAPGWQQPEVRILFTGRAVSQSPNHWAIANIDSLRVFAGADEDFVNLYDHVPGFPGSFLQSGLLPVEAAISSLASQGSDVSARRGRWVLDEVGLSDTTFVAASGDRRYVAFGEGARAPAGRIILWDGATATISNEVSVADLVSNASERVTGVGLNQNGSLGVARGTQGAYFFNTGLRLQGVYRQGTAGGAGGASIRPNSVTPSTLAFVGTARNTIQIIGTDNYLPRGEIAIRDNIAGPLRASEPLPQDNAGRSCPGDPDCVVVKLYGVTASGGVVIVDVRERDIS